MLVKILVLFLMVYLLINVHKADDVDPAPISDEEARKTIESNKKSGCSATSTDEEKQLFDCCVKEKGNVYYNAVVDLTKPCGKCNKFLAQPSDLSTCDSENPVLGNGGSLIPICNTIGIDGKDVELVKCYSNKIGRSPDSDVLMECESGGTTQNTCQNR